MGELEVASGPVIRDFEGVSEWIKQINPTLSVSPRTLADLRRSNPEKSTNPFPASKFVGKKLYMDARKVYEWLIKDL